MRTTWRCTALLWMLPLLLIGCAQTSVAPLATVPQVDLDRYLGTWYEIAMLPNRFQGRCVGNTRAEYSREVDRIRVINRCMEKSGSSAEARGIAKVVPGSGNAKLKVSFFRPFYGDYWILALDPAYRWVLVGEPRRQYGWVLSRTPQMGDAELEAVLAHAAALGYDVRRFVRTSHSVQ